MSRVAFPRRRTRFVIATRAAGQAVFALETPTGQSLSAMAACGVEVHLFSANARGLPSVYNEAIEAAGEDDIDLVFVHDDVLLVDFFIRERVSAGLQAFDVIGVVGNARRLSGQPAWWLVREGVWDEAGHFSGVLAHGAGYPSGKVTVYGDTPRQVQLLDGVFLAASNRLLKRTGLRFDERFAFHFYDLDFCREAERRGLRLGTWPIALVHASGGHLGTPAWREAYRAYLAKWGEAAPS